MAEDLLTQQTVSRVLGRPRLMRFVRAGWLKPVERSPRVLFSPRDVHACLRRLERFETLPPDKIESARTHDSAVRHGRGYVLKGRKVRPAADEIVLDFSAFNGC
jgi:hypothetical protein